MVRRIAIGRLPVSLHHAPLGFDTLDYILDVVVSLDRRSLAWTEAGPLAEALSRGLVTPEAAHATRTEGEHRLQLLLAGELPYAPEWEPDPAWGVPALHLAAN